MTEIWLAFLAGLAGSGHCIGMCGGIVAALSLSCAAHPTHRPFHSLLAYHAGRILTYTLLGALAGAVSQLALLSVLKPLFSWLILLVHSLVLLLGLATLLAIRPLSLSRLDGAGWPIMQRVMQRAVGSSGLSGFFLVGLVMGLLPCGLVYGVLLSGSASGSWLAGGGMMLAFGAGTLPALLAYGRVAHAIGALANSLFLRLMGAVVALLGAVGVYKALVALGAAVKLNALK